MPETQKLRQRAQKCRTLAAGMSSKRDIDTLNQLAAEYEAEASRVEMMRVPLESAGDIRLA